MRTNIYLSVIATYTILTFQSVYAQNSVTNSSRSALHNEIPDDEYQPANSGPRITSPAYRRESSLFYMTQVNVDADGNNILQDAANEPSLAIDPVNEGRMAIGWRQFDNVGNNFRQAGYAYTTDGGETWTFPGVIDPGIFRSDPVLETDASGVFYYNSLSTSSGNYYCRVFRSNSGGADWDEGVPAQGGDKQWMEIDKSGNPSDGNIYAFWTSYYSYCYPGNFTRSTDGGENYEDCVTVDGNPYWGTLAIGPESELYIVGTGYNDGLVVARSNNAADPTQYVAWDYYTYVDMDGYMTAGPNVNPAGLLGQASIAVNQAFDSHRGEVYVLSSVQRLSVNDPGDVMFAKSTDGGLTFSNPVRINDDLSLSNTQWFGTMSVAPNGRIDVVWLDTRDAPVGNPLYSALYYCYSIDCGETWSANERLSESFDPHLGWPNQEKMGDYFDMISDNGNAHLAWCNTLNGEQDVYYGRITPLITSVANTSNIMDKAAISPNPVNSHSRLNFTLQQSSKVSVSIYDITGRLIRQWNEAEFQAGRHTTELGNFASKPGVYFCKIRAGNQSISLKMIKLSE